MMDHGALAVLRDALALADGASGVHACAVAQLRLAQAHLQIAELDEARPYLAARLRAFRHSSERLSSLPALETAAALCARGDRHVAARLWGAAAAQREAIGAPMWSVDRPSYEAAVAAARRLQGDESFDAAWRDGRALTWEQAVDEALAAGPRERAA